MGTERDAEMIRLRLGRALQSARIDRGLTQLEVADRLGRSQSAVSDWERGIREPSVIELVGLRQLYSIPIHALDPFLH